MARLTNTSKVGYTPTAWMHFPPGVSTPNGAFAKLSAGVVLTSLENGALEYDGTYLYLTIGSTRTKFLFSNIVTTKGDLLVATGSNVIARLAVGSNSQLLIADSAQSTGIKWGNPTAASLSISTNKLIGRASSGTGAGEEITCTSAGRAILDDADATAQRATLGLGDSATKNVGTVAGTVAAGDHTHAATALTITSSNKILGRATAGSGTVEELNCTQAGRDLIDDIDAAAQRTTLGLGNAATKNVGTGENDVAAGNHVHAEGAKTEDVAVLAPDGTTTRTLHFVNGQYTGYSDS